MKRNSRMRMLVQAEGSVGFFHPASVYGVNTCVGLFQDLGHVGFSSARPSGASARLVQGQRLRHLLLSELLGAGGRQGGRSGRFAVPS